MNKQLELSLAAALPLPEWLMSVRAALVGTVAGLAFRLGALSSDDTDSESSSSEEERSDDPVASSLSEPATLALEFTTSASDSEHESLSSSSDEEGACTFLAKGPFVTGFSSSDDSEVDDDESESSSDSEDG